MAAPDWQLPDDQEHCMPGVDDDGSPTWCTDVDGGGDCVCCECCCACLGCEYGPRDGLMLSAEQRAPIAAMTLGQPAGQPTDRPTGLVAPATDTDRKD